MILMGSLSLSLCTSIYLSLINPQTAPNLMMVVVTTCKNCKEGMAVSGDAQLHPQQQGGAVKLWVSQGSHTLLLLAQREVRTTYFSAHEKRIEYRCKMCNWILL